MWGAIAPVPGVPPRSRHAASKAAAAGRWVKAEPGAGNVAHAACPAPGAVVRV
jgi:hypothetical protein